MPIVTRPARHRSGRTWQTVHIVRLGEHDRLDETILAWLTESYLTAG